MYGINNRYAYRSHRYSSADWNTGPPDMYSDIGHSTASNGKPIDYPAAHFYHAPSVCKLFHYNCSVKVIHVRWCMPRFHARHVTRELVVTRYVYEFILRNNPAEPSRDKSFLEFYLVIEFPGVWRELTLTLARYAERQVATSRCCNAAVTEPPCWRPRAEIDRVRYLYTLFALFWYSLSMMSSL